MRFILNLQHYQLPNKAGISSFYNKTLPGTVTSSQNTKQYDPLSKNLLSQQWLLLPSLLRHKTQGLKHHAQLERRAGHTQSDPHVLPRRPSRLSAHLLIKFQTLCPNQVRVKPSRAVGFFWFFHLLQLQFREERAASVGLILFQRHSKLCVLFRTATMPQQNI